MKTLKSLFISSFSLLFLFLTNVIAQTITVKCHIDDDKSFSFLIDKNKKEVLWLDENNQKLKITIFPIPEKGGNLLIMGGVNAKKEKHTFILDTRISVLNVVTNLGYKKAGKCGDKSIFEYKE